MTPHAWNSLLLSASIEGAVLLLAVWAVTRLWPHMPAAARCGLWWLGSLRMLYGLLPLPFLPLKMASDWIPAPSPLPAPVLKWGQAVAGAVVTRETGAGARPPMELVATGLAIVWAAGLVIGAALMAHRLIRLRRMWREAAPFDDPRALRWREDWVIALGHAGVPEIRVSPDTLVPVTIGCRRPGILLPVDAGSLPDDALRMVFAHELSHVRRRDPLLAWIPAAAQLVFWFHPLVRLAGREYLAAREQICDADALRATGVSPRDYGALLLEFGVGNTSDLPGAASCGSPGARDLKRRLDMLSRSAAIPTVHRVGAAVLVIAILTVGFTPVRLVVARESMGKAAELAGRERAPIAYLLKTKGMKGTRGSVDMTDMESARKLDEADENAVYIRLGERMWISRDEAVIAEVRKALEPEDRFDVRREVAEGRRQALEEERMVLEGQREWLQERKRVLEARKDALQRTIEGLRDAGKSTRSPAGEAVEIDAELEVLWVSEKDLWNANRLLEERLKALYADEKVKYEEMNAMHRKILEQIARIGRRAIEEGRAEVMVP